MSEAVQGEVGSGEMQNIVFKQHGEIEDTPHKSSLEWAGCEMSALVDPPNLFKEPVVCL